MEILELGFRLLLAFALGAAIGLEREVNEKKSTPHHKVPSAVLGIRSFSLITVLGAITGFIYLEFIPLALLIASAFFVLLLIFYYIDSRVTNDYGLTTEVAGIYSFVIGMLLATSLLPLQITIAVTIVVILLLSQKGKIKDMVYGISTTELNTFIIYAILALVVMPFLPNANYSISDFRGLNNFLRNVGVPIENLAGIDLVNPFKTWLILVLITGVDLVSYILSKLIGEKKGWLVASAVGGLVSSTATTQSIAQQSKTSRDQDHLVAAAIVSNLVSFFQIGILVGLVNGVFFVRLLPIISILIFVSTIVFLFFLKTKERGKNNTHAKNISQNIQIIDLSSALKFAGLYLTISIVSKIALSLFGNTGLLIATGIGAFTGLDAVMINISQLAGSGVEYGIAIFAFILANSVNLFAKSFYAFVGKKEFGKKFAISMGIIVLSSLVGYLFF